MHSRGGVWPGTDVDLTLSRGAARGQSPRRQGSQDAEAEAGMCKPESRGQGLWLVQISGGPASAGAWQSFSCGSCWDGSRPSDSPGKQAKGKDRCEEY